MRLLAAAMTVFLTGCAAHAPVTGVGRVPSGGALKISASPVMMFAGQAVMLTWRIERELNPRSFCVEIVGFRRFCEDNPSRRIYQQLVEGMPEGRWPVVLTVYLADAQSRTTATEVCVSGLEVQCGGPN